MNKTSLKGKIVIIGAGNVGSTVAYTILMNNLVSEIVIIDVNKEKAQGEALDMNHGIAYFKQISIRSGEYSECEDADIIIITAGIARRSGQTRNELAKINVSIAKDITKNIMTYAKNPIILVISNPVDILTYVIQKESGLPSSRVIGSGTTLDTARLRYLLSVHCDIDVRNVHAYIIGEHGDSEVAVWSRANIAGKPFNEFCDDCPKKCHSVNRQKILENTITSGAEIIKLKGATFYGIGMAATRIVAAIINDEKAVLTVSSVLSGEYKVRDVALSLPCVVDSEGIERYINIRMSDKEILDFQQSSEKIKQAIKEINK
jgi:L-lactate dehydrogenase